MPRQATTNQPQFERSFNQQRAETLTDQSITWPQRLPKYKNNSATARKVTPSCLSLFRHTHPTPHIPPSLILADQPPLPHRISEGSYYEAHQQIRTITARYVKSLDWDAAIDVLYSGALALLKVGQGGSGGDLGCFLVEVLGKSEKGCGSAEKSA